MNALINQFVLITLLFALGLSGNSINDTQIDMNFSAKLSNVKGQFGSDLQGKVEPTTLRPESAATLARIRLDLMDQLGGSIFSVAVKGNLAFVGVGPRLVVFDISDTQNPTVIGRGPFWDYDFDILDIVIVDQLAYVANENRGVRIVDISNPAEPTQISRFDSYCIARDIAISGNILYLADSCGGMSIVDITDPAKPTQLSEFLAFHFINGVTVMGENYVFVDSDWGNGVVDVSDPTKPKGIWFNGSPITYQSSPAKDYGGVVDGPYLYTILSDGLYVFDITDPTNPMYVSEMKGAWKFAKNGNTIYLAGGGLGIYDVTDIHHPLYIRSIGFPEGAEDDVTDVKVSGDYLVITLRSLGIKIFDITDPANPIEVGDFVTLGGYTSIPEVLIGNYLYIGYTNFGVRIFDISDSTFPEEVANYALPMPNAVLRGMDIEGDRLCLAAYDDGMRMLDISDPTQPKELGIYQTPPAYNILSVDCVENLAYIGVYGYSIRVIDFSNPAEPKEISNYPVTSVGQICVYGNIVYSFPNNDLHAIDFTNFAQPQEIGFAKGPFTPKYMAISGKYAFFGTSKGVQVLDISDPYHISNVILYETTEFPSSIKIIGNIMYLAIYDEGIMILDITNIFNFTEIGHYKMWYPYARNILVKENLIYLFGRYGTLTFQAEQIPFVFLPVIRK